LIGRLLGRVSDDGDTLLVDVRGVGYEVLAPLGTRGRLPIDAAGDSTLFVHTHVREDAMTLFGFASLEERDAFRVLISISNVGPKLALAVLGFVTVRDLSSIVARGEVAKLTSIPGVGKKTAERLVLELKGKLQVSTATASVSATPPLSSNPGTTTELVVGALTRMGYRPNEAERAIGTLAQTRSLDDVPLGDLIRDALAILAK
jgi:Holliday junction DNA helicase RuvA